MMSHLCNRCVRELLILARTWFAFGLPSKPGVTMGLDATWRIVPCHRPAHSGLFVIVHECIVGQGAGVP
jgi:hypothetical protein